MPLFKADPAILQLLTKISEKLDQIMSTNNVLATLAHQVLEQVKQLQTELDASTTDVKASLDNFQKWLSSAQAASTIDPVVLNDLQQAAALIGSFHSVVQSIDASAKTADPGIPPVAPVNG